VTAREKFKIGDRVRLNADGLRYHRGSRAPTSGRVVGFSRGSAELAIRVLRDGRKTVVTAHAPWWEVDPTKSAPDLDKAAEALVKAFWLYSGYTVGSRGPSGCILDALDEIAPDVAKEIRNGDEAHDVYQRRWSDIQ
jgi:hypothetical protein